MLCNIRRKLISFEAFEVMAQIDWQGKDSRES
jgi:hypothetical protein